jgi:hypothetical protein
MQSASRIRPASMPRVAAGRIDFGFFSVPAPSRRLVTESLRLDGPDLAVRGARSGPVRMIQTVSPPPREKDDLTHLWGEDVPAESTRPQRSNNQLAARKTRNPLSPGCEGGCRGHATGTSGSPSFSCALRGRRSSGGTKSRLPYASAHLLWVPGFRGLAVRGRRAANALAAARTRFAAIRGGCRRTKARK